MCSTCSSSSSFRSVRVLFFFSNDWPIRAANSKSRSFCEKQKWKQRVKKKKKKNKKNPRLPAGTNSARRRRRKTKALETTKGLRIHHPVTGVTAFDTCSKRRMVWPRDVQKGATRTSSNEREPSHLTRVSLCSSGEKTCSQKHFSTTAFDICVGI